MWASQLRGEEEEKATGRRWEEMKTGEGGLEVELADFRPPAVRTGK